MCWAERPLPADADRFESHVFRADAGFEVACLRELTKAMPPGVLRLKDVVRSDEQGWSELRFAGHHGVFRRPSPRHRTTQPRS